MYLPLRPTWSNRELTQEEVQITQTLYQIFQDVIAERQSLICQVKRVIEQRGNQPITTFTGNVIDDLFKERVRAAIASGDLPKRLQVTPQGVKGPDIWIGRAAWDITTAEQGKYHIKRDVYGDPYRWDVYFLLGY